MEDWLKDSGALGLDDLEVKDFPITGRGVGAKRAFKKNERILTIPAKCLWTVKRAYDDPLFGPVLRSLSTPLSVEDTLALYILFVRSRPEDPAYKELQTHIAVLPKSYTSSIFFTDDELKVCAGSSLYAVTIRHRDQIGEDHRNLLISVFIRHRSLFPLDKFGIEDYKWALCTVWSRGMDFAVPGNPIRLLAPFADMFNHWPKGSEDKACHAYETSTGDMHVNALNDYQAGDQVFIHYSEVPNSRLLHLYGFVLPNNPHDSYRLPLSTPPEVPLYEEKKRLWKCAGLAPDCDVLLGKDGDPLPSEVLQYVRIQQLEAHNLHANTMRSFDDKYETHILQFLIKSFEDLLEPFGIPRATLDARCKDSMYPPGSNVWAAAQVSAGEQLVLEKAKEKAVELLDAVGTTPVENGAAKANGVRVEAVDAPPPPPDRCANCDKDAAAAKLTPCGNCRAIVYCGRPCRLANHKKHKKECAALAAKKLRVTS